MYSALELSKYIVNKCANENLPISNLQLQKILYYIQKEFLQRLDRRAFSDEIEAWQFGPVVPNCYYFFCGFGSMPITSTYSNAINLSSYDKAEIDTIVEQKRILNPWDMVAETHKANGAWDQIYNNGQGNRDIIPTELIRKVG